MLKLIHYITYLVLAFPIVSHATCYKVTSTSLLSSQIIAAGYTAKSWSGAAHGTTGKLGLPSVISLSTNDSFMPTGTLLASSTAPFITGGSNTAYTANQILFRCDISDAGSLTEIYGTNSYYIYTGKYLVDDIEGAYYTYSKNIAVRFTNLKTGQYFYSNWQSRELNSDDWIQDDDYIYIPASAFSDVGVEVFKTASTSYSGDSSNYYYYSYTPGQAFITLRGPGLSSSVIIDGTDLGINQSGFSSQWPGGFSLYHNVTIVRGAICLVKDYPSVVLLPTISTASLNSGETSQSTFDISLSCEDSAVSSVSQSTSSSANVAMGFLVNQSKAVTAATALGLTSTSGLTHLLDTNYGSSGVASGVGIRLYDESGNALNLLSSKTAATGNAGGWYAYKDLTTSQDDSTDGVTTYTGSFTASLEAISGETVTAGTVNAQLQVVVSFQ